MVPHHDHDSHGVDAEVPAADAQEQERELVEGGLDPEAAVTGSIDVADLEADEADVLEQRLEVELDDDGYGAPSDD